MSRMSELDAKLREVGIDPGRVDMEAGHPILTAIHKKLSKSPAFKGLPIYRDRLQNREWPTVVVKKKDREGVVEVI